MGSRSKRVDHLDGTDRLLAAWRRPSARRPSDGEIDRLRALLASGIAPNRRGWSAALVDASAAVGMAIRSMAEDAVFGLAADLVFSNLLSHAAEGDRTAAMVLGKARAKRRAVDGRIGRILP